MIDYSIPEQRDKVVNLVMESMVNMRDDIMDGNLPEGEDRYLLHDVNRVTKTVSALQKRVEFLEARNTELQECNTKMRARAMSAERLVTVSQGSPLRFPFKVDEHTTITDMLNTCSDYFAATSAKADVRAWRNLLTYCPLDELEAEYCKKVQTA